MIYFKEVYNLICEKDDGKDIFFNYMIKNENIQKYNFINIIITNINDCRFIFLYLLLIHFIKNYRYKMGIGDWAQYS